MFIADEVAKLEALRAQGELTTLNLRGPGRRFLHRRRHVPLRTATTATTPATLIAPAIAKRRAFPQPY
jgi:hypothetical protein